MKKSLLIILLISFCSIFVKGQSNDNSALFLRGGISDITGFVAGEYFVGKSSISIGWHKYAPKALTDESKSSFDIGLYFYTAPYYENSAYVAIGYASANSVQTINGIVDDFYSTWTLIGGYRFGGESMDLKIGAGYLSSEVMNGLGVDLSIGISF